MNKTFFSFCAYCTLLVLVMPGVVLAQVYDVPVKLSQDMTALPDVDKSPFPPPPTDKSCWLAAASNLLGGGGWGLSGQTAQQNANSIYGHMTTHFGTQYAGDPALALNWWLYNYGYNPEEAPNGWYRPTLTYNDVTTDNKQLKDVDYDMLLQQLVDNQYVAVNWSTATGDHTMTLVGGNWSNVHMPPGTPPAQSVWHDSDRTQGGTADDVYTNAFDGAGNWSLSDYVTLGGTGYTYLCPGVQKPDEAMSNYDAAYYRDQDAITGSGSYAWRIAGDNGQNYGTPTWEQDGLLEYTILDVPNESILGMHKEVYLLVDFETGLYDELSAPAIVVEASGTTYDTPELTISEGGGQILYHWTLDDQPDSERIIFPDETFYYLGGDVKDFNVATYCIPEPSTLVLIVISILGLAFYGWRRNR